MDQCFICLETDNTLIKDACNCNTAVHLDCLLMAIKKVEAHSSANCPMCKCSYNNDVS